MVEGEMPRMRMGPGETYQGFMTEDGPMGYKKGKLAIFGVAMVVVLVSCACLRVGREQDCLEKGM